MSQPPPGSRPRFDDATATLVRTKPRPLGAVVRVLGAEARPAELRLGSSVVRVGSSESCDLVVADRAVSREHCELALEPEGVSVRDLGSRNGLFYLGQRVERIVLPFGGRVQVGSVTLAIDVDTASLDHDLAPYPGDSYRGRVGASRAMRLLFARLARLESSVVPVLVLGESGVGKELVAGALHEGSRLAAGPLVVVNCGAFARELVASELFGHVRGAFTGAHAARRGAFERADGGTLFLDEVGELPLEVQPALLRALECGDIQPVGGESTRRVRVRLVAATHRDLPADVRAGRFREDLYYRLAVVTLRVPPLCERPEDIEPLARRFAVAAGLDVLPAPVVARLAARTWRGNARELRNAVQAYAAMGALPEDEAVAAGAGAHPRVGEGVLEAALAERIDPTRPYLEQKDALVERFTRLYLDALMSHTGGNQTTAAALAGLTRTYLGRLLDKHRVTKGRR
ncbi:MAG: sigma 54-dependent Fis family transcriptional regulator [Polyangiaceae bacterium]|nr:sigma 54-dependent Fis family transcriptional regulator [Polyangiaceae bacterium]